MNQTKTIYEATVWQKLYKRVRPWLIALVAVMALSLNVRADVFDAFTQAHGRYVWGDYILAGNSVMRCITAADPDTRDVNSNSNTTEALGPLIGWTHYAACLADSQQTTNPAAFDPVPNDQRWMVFNNTDTSGATFNSSEAAFSIPPGADITFARLYWSGNRAEAVNDGTLNPTSQVPLMQANGQQGTAASPWYSCNSASATFDWSTYGSATTLTNATIVSRRQTAAQRLDGQLNEMRIRVNSSTYQTITADEGPYFGVQNFGGVYFASQADVTAYMQQQLDANESAGVPTQLTVTGADIATGQGFNCHGGWTLAVVYEYPTRDATYAPDLRFVEIFDGMAEAVSSTTGPGDAGNPDEVNLAMSQFTAASGVVEPRFGILAYEGDQGLVNDQMQFEFGEPQQINVTEPKTGRNDNYFSSTVGDYSDFSTGFDPQVTRSPLWENNDGIDSKVDGLDPNILTNSGANLNVRIFTSGDRFVVQAVTFSAVVASISGTVYEDDNNNGQQDGGEAGIPGVTLTLTGTDSNGNPVNMTATTDANGDYTFVNVPPSNPAGYVITETQPTNYLDGQDAAGTVGGTTVGTAQEPDTIIGIVFNPLDGSGFDYDFGEIQPAQLSGSVYEDLDSDGVQDAGEPPIQGVLITLSGDASNTATTDASGYYEFTNLAPGSYTVTETDPSGFSSTGSEQGTVGSTPVDNNTIDVTLQAGDNSQQNDFLDERPLGSISGTICINVNDDGLCDANESPIEGVTVTLDDGDPNTPPLVTATDDNGFYEFTDLPANSYAITETQPSGYTSVNDADGGTDDVISVTLQAGENKVDQDFIEEALPARLSGSVYDDLNNNGVQDSGEPGIPNVTITLSGDGLGTIPTDASGYYEFTNLAPGSYIVTETDPSGYTSTGAEQGTVGSNVTDNNTIQVILSAGGDSQQNDFLDGQAPTSIDLKKILNGAGPFQPGDSINFTIRVTNTGGITLTNIPLTDTYDLAYLTYDSVMDAIGPNPATEATNDGSIYWANVISFDNDGQLDPNEVLNLTVTFIAKAATSNLAGGMECEPAGYTYNKASSSGQESCVEVQIDPAPGKSTVGDFVWYDVNGDGVKDAGEEGIDGVRVELYEVVDLGGGITETQFITFQLTGPDRTGIDSDDTPTYGDAGAYDFQVLDNKTYQVVITDTNFLPGGALENYVYVGDNASEPYNGPNPRTVTIGAQEDYNDADFPFTLVPTLQLTKVLNGVNPFSIGANVSFTIRITNTGSVTITTLPLEDRYSSAFIAYDSATPAPDSALDGVLTWTDLLASLNDTDGLGIGESVRVDVTFTTEADTTLLSAVAPCTEDGQAPNLARVMNAMADTMPVVPDADDSACASVQILNPTGIELAGRSLQQTPEGVLVRWSMVEETNVVGFYIWRANGVESTRRSEMILTKVGGQQSNSVVYEWLDAEATLTRGDAYVLEIVYTDETSERTIIDVRAGVSLYLPLMER